MMCPRSQNQTLDLSELGAVTGVIRHVDRPALLDLWPTCYKGHMQVETYAASRELSMVDRCKHALPANTQFGCGYLTCFGPNTEAVRLSSGLPRQPSDDECQ
jgi:hypothetical protein